MTVRSWLWDRVPSEQRGQLILGDHLARCLFEITGCIVAGAIQIAIYTITDRLRRNRGRTN